MPMLPTGFEPAIPASRRLQTSTLDLTVTGIVKLATNGTVYIAMNTSNYVRPLSTKPIFTKFSLVYISHILAARPALRIFYQTSWFCSCIEYSV